MSERPRETAMQPPEVHVRSVRRRRSETPKPVIQPPPDVRGWLIYTVLIVGVLVLMVEGFLRHRPNQPPLPSLSHATEVRSILSEVADSLRVVVSWDLTLSDPGGKPDSIRIKVAPQQKQAVMAFQSSNQLADTVYLPLPSRGEALNGISCASAAHPGALPQDESCTPWQFVRPAAEPAGVLGQIVIRPSGLQVDPDVEGRCARWQRDHPDSTVWIAVNRTAVPDCTGPNRKPTVAQFCAFAVLPGGKRVKTANSTNSGYCDELFVEWSRELYS
jgi:hypothetical protein